MSRVYDGLGAEAGAAVDRLFVLHIATEVGALLVEDVAGIGIRADHGRRGAEIAGGVEDTSCDLDFGGGHHSD